MDANEEYVRSKWEDVTYADTAIGVLAREQAALAELRRGMK